MYSAYIYDYYDYPIIKKFDTREDFDSWYQENKDGDLMIMEKGYDSDDWEYFHTIDGLAVSDEDYFAYQESYDESDESDEFLLNDTLGFNEDYELNELDDEIHF